MRKKFILFGAGGYVAPKHFKAIKDTNNDLVASYDVNDSVGILDSYFPNSKFFTNESKIIKYIEESNLNYKTKIDYMVICTPNYLHESQIRLGLRMNLNVICENGDSCSIACGYGAEFDGFPCLGTNILLLL